MKSGTEQLLEVEGACPTRVQPAVASITYFDFRSVTSRFQNQVMPGFLYLHLELAHAFEM